MRSPSRADDMNSEFSDTVTSCSSGALFARRLSRT
jgi:hypothetical protein